MLLGEFVVSLPTFSGVEELLSSFREPSFLAKPERERSSEINKALLQKIQKSPFPCFLLRAVLDFVEKIDKGGFLHHYTFSSFEIWLNHLSTLSFEENLLVRSKIVGKKIDRRDYQLFFPIGTGKVFEGTHFVTAHRSPDLDTTVASFWGWVDAFGARVGSGLHVWNVPGGPPEGQVEIPLLFEGIFGSSIFSHLAKSKQQLSVSSQDLMQQKGLVHKTLQEGIGEVIHDKDQVAVIVVDDQGFYLGDWRHFDVEGVRRVILLLGSLLRWWENRLHLQLISLFAKEEVTQRDVERGIETLLGEKIEKAEPIFEWSSPQKQEVEQFLEKVLHVKKKLQVSWEELGQILSQHSGIEFQGKDSFLEALEPLFDGKGALLAKRPAIFTFLEKIVRNLHEGIFHIRSRLEKLDIALLTKKEVFQRTPTFVTSRSDVEEIRQKMGSYLSLTVVYPDKDKYYPVGIVQAQEIRKTILGTVSLRDFCNKEEMGIPPYLDVISVLDHHKSQMQTSSTPFAIVADVQSTNTLVAGQAFLLNDLYSLRGQSESSIAKALQASSFSSYRVVERLGKKHRVAKTVGPCVDPMREYVEYLHFLFGILDDTDLLSKVTPLDVERVAELLNRMKSIVEKEEVEILSLDDLPRDALFAKKGAERILRQKDMYSLYQRIYLAKERQVETIMEETLLRRSTLFFSDTKEQNGCALVGQTKLFAKNFPKYLENRGALISLWLAIAKEKARHSPEISLYLHMISTIVSAEEVYRGEYPPRSHEDELWIWIPSTEGGAEKLKRFLLQWQTSPLFPGTPFHLTLYGKESPFLASLFTEGGMKCPFQEKEHEESFAILSYPAGAINSRKALLTPYLPKG